MIWEPLAAVGIANSVVTPAVVIRPILLPEKLGEPEVAVGPGCDPARLAPRRRYRELGDESGRRDPPDLVGGGLREPEVAVGTGRDRLGEAPRGGDCEFGDDARRRDPSDVVGVLLTEPQVAVGPAVIATGVLPAVSGNSLTVPLVVIRPMLLLVGSVNQRLPSDPAVMALAGPAGGVASSVIAPVSGTSVSIVPARSVNHMLPSGPGAMSIGVVLPAGTEYSMIVPPGLARATDMPVTANVVAAMSTTMSARARVIMRSASVF